MIKEPLHTSLEKFFSTLEKNASREKAWKQYLAVGLPTRKQEPFRYIKLRHLYGLHYSTPQKKTPTPTQILPECTNSYLTIVNGAFCKELSNTTAIPELIALPFSEAHKTYGTFIRNQSKILMQTDLDPFASINRALHQEGLFLFLPRDVQCDTPLQILHLNDHDDPHTLLLPRTQIALSSGSFLKIAVITETLGEPSIQTNSLTEISIAEGADLKVTQIDPEPHLGWTLQSTRANLEKGSNLTFTQITKGSRTTRHDMQVSLSGIAATASLNGLSLLEGKNESHFHLLLNHKAPGCTSNQLFKSILKENSRASFEGKIYVHQAAQQTEAYQMCRSLLLDDTAISYAKPNLEIFADDVKASHGATVGQIDPEQRIYLLSRGIPPQLADQMLIESFCSEVLDTITFPSLRKC